MTEKRCPKCDAVKPLDAFPRRSGATDGRASHCRSCVKEWAAAHPEQAASRQARWKERNPEKSARSQRFFANRKTAARRVAVIHYYSSGANICACCGSAERLTIDHIYGGGTEHRKAIRATGAPFYRWLVAQSFPPGYQVLCMDCNVSKGTGESCRRHAAATA